jgi:hypothetical protein
LTELEAMAPTLPTTIVSAASAATAGAQSSIVGSIARSRKRRMIAKAAALVATAMNAVTGVGAPW